MLFLEFNYANTTGDRNFRLSTNGRDNSKVLLEKNVVQKCLPYLFVHILILFVTDPFTFLKVSKEMFGISMGNVLFQIYQNTRQINAHFCL